MRRKKKSNFLKNAIISHINQNSKLYILLIFIFFIGLVIGIICINHTNIEGQNQINTYITRFINNVKSQDEINYNELILRSIKNNAIFVLILLFLGSTIIGIPLIYMIILYKGYSLGYTLSAIFATLGRYQGNNYQFNNNFTIFYLHSCNNCGSSK